MIRLLYLLIENHRKTIIELITSVKESFFLIRADSIASELIRKHISCQSIHGDR